MSISSNRNIQIEFSDGFKLEIIQSALENIASPGRSELITLIPGGNQINTPVITGIVVTAVTIIPPAGNLIQLTLKGTATDLGIPLHLTDPSSIALSPIFTDLNIDAGGTVEGLLLLWS